VGHSSPLAVTTHDALRDLEEWRISVLSVRQKVHWPMLEPTFTLKLSANGLKNIPPFEPGDVFHFLVGGDTYDCPFVVAAFLSPNVAQLRLIDKTQDELVINARDENRLFESFLLLGRGHELSVSASTATFFGSVCEELGNVELLSMIWDDFGGSLDVRSCISRLRLLRSLDGTRKREVDYLASHFHELSPTDFSQLEVEDLYEILSQDSLKLLSEDCLFEFLCSSFEQSDCYFGLLEFVRFEYLSAEMIDRFAPFSFESFDFLTVSIWHRICERLSLPLIWLQPKSRLVGRPIFTKRTGTETPIAGIIDFLTHQCGGNVHDRGVVKITSPTNGGFFVPKNAADLFSNSLFGESIGPDRWLCYEFVTGTVYLTGYSIRSQYQFGSGWAHLKEWVVETSMEGEDWTIVDQRTDNHELDAKNATVWFEISESYHRECRFVRLRQTGPNHAGNTALYLSAFEVFGDLLEQENSSDDLSAVGQ
jgi:hypothetical protein